MTFYMYLQSLGWEFMLSFGTIAFFIAMYSVIAVVSWITSKIKKVVR